MGRWYIKTDVWMLTYQKWQHPTETQPLPELETEPVFFKGLSILEEGCKFKIYLFVVLLKLG